MSKEKKGCHGTIHTHVHGGTQFRYGKTYTVKRIRISEKDTLFFVTLIEHKTKVDYNVSMQLLRYMVYIWDDYEKEMEKKTLTR